MKNAKEIFDINHYLSLVVRNRWFIIIPFCIALVVGIFFALTLPNVYKATTLIMVEPQRVPTNYVKSIVSTDIASRISNISKQILSRTNLENIITEFNLFSEPEQTNMFMEDKLASLRKRIAVQVSKSRSGNDAFSISFKGTAPQTVTKITNTLASYFIDENLKFRESQATGTNVFLDEELSSTRNRLEGIETSLNKFRKQYMGELPEQLASNLAILARMQEQLIEKQKSLRETRAMLATLQQQASAAPSFEIDESFFTTDDSLEIEGGGSSDLGQLKEQLSRLKLRYTDRHPDVVRLQSTIARLETQIEEESDSVKEDLAAEPSESEMTSELSEMSFLDLQKIQKDEIGRDIRQQVTEIAKLVKDIAVYQQRIENTPKREQDLLSLQRDYDNIKDSYDSLVQRKLEAEIAVNMEKKQKGEQFRILDSAKMPEKPISPNVMQLFLMSVAAGLGIGCGFVFLLDFFDTTIRKQDDLESVIGIPVLSTIPRIYYAGDKRWIRINQVITFFSMVIAFTLIAGFALLAIKGVDPTVEYVRKFANL